MQTSLRLYSPYDNDLIALRIIEGRKFSKIVREAIRACVNNKPYTIHVPTNLYKYIYESDKPFLVNLTFNDNEDVKVISLVSNFKRGTTNSILKTMIRSRLDGFPVGAFLPDTMREDFPLVTLRGSISTINKLEDNIDPKSLYKPKKLDPRLSVKKTKLSDKEKPNPDKQDKKDLSSVNISTPEPSLHSESSDLKDDTSHSSHEEEPKGPDIIETAEAEAAEDVFGPNDDIFSMLEGMVNH